MHKFNLPALILFSATSPLFAMEISYQYDSLNRLTVVDYGEGQQTIQYRYDNAGNIISTNITVSDQFPPNLSISSPIDGATLSTNTLVISGTASDAGRGGSGISSILVNGQLATGAIAETTATANWSLETTLTYGANTLTVVASDGSPFNNRSSQTINISYQPPFVDSDTDTVDDHWEQFYFGNLITVTATTDSDGDGVSDYDEYKANSNPTDSRSRAVQSLLSLKTGFQQLFYPLENPDISSAFALLTHLDSLGVAISEIKALDQQSGIFHTAHIDQQAGTLSGDDFSLTPGQGVYAQITADSTFPISGSVQCRTVDLSAGINIVGFQCIPANYSAFQLLNAIGDQSLVNSIQKFDRLTGRFETVGYQGNSIVGSDFIIKAGEAYIIYMTNDLVGFDPILE